MTQLEDEGNDPTVTQESFINGEPRYKSAFDLEEDEHESVGESDVNKVRVIDVELDQPELKLFVKPPNYAINPSFNSKDFREAIEIAHTKVRYAAVSDNPPTEEGGEVEDGEMTPELQ